MAEASSSALSCRRLPEAQPCADASGDGSGRRWYAVFTVPRNEKSTARQLNLREIESFVPTCESVRLWKNRQRVRVVQPLFPCYLFVRIARPERSRVLASPGVLRIVGNSREPLPVADATIEFLRSDLWANKLEPYREIIVGQRVRIRSGAMEGLEGVLVRKNNNLRFVLSVDLINQHAAVEIDADRLEPVGR